jgi:hypothetical protein
MDKVRDVDKQIAKTLKEVRDKLKQFRALIKKFAPDESLLDDHFAPYR